MTNHTNLAKQKLINRSLDFTRNKIILWWISPIRSNKSYSVIGFYTEWNYFVMNFTNSVKQNYPVIGLNMDWYYFCIKFPQFGQTEVIRSLDFTHIKIILWRNSPIRPNSSYLEIGLYTEWYYFMTNLTNWAKQKLFGHWTLRGMKLFCDEFHQFGQTKLSSQWTLNRLKLFCDEFHQLGQTEVIRSLDFTRNKIILLQIAQIGPNKSYSVIGRYT